MDLATYFRTVMALSRSIVVTLDANGRVIHGNTLLEQTTGYRLMELIGLYVGNLRDDHAAVNLKDVRAHLPGTYFAWKGDITANSVFYYRIQSPVILIEFDHQGPIALDGDRGTPTRRHVHTVVRTPNGNDYGKDLLRQHYKQFEGVPGHGHQER